MTDRTETERITITPDDIARYERRMVLSGGTSEEQSRVMDCRTVDARELHGRQHLLLPSRCVAHARRDDVDVYVIEQRPTTRTVFLTTRIWGRTENYDMVEQELVEQRAYEVLGMTEQELRSKILARSSSTSQTFTLAFPYVILMTRFNKGVFHRLHIFYRNDTITSARDQLYHANMPNMHDTGLVCLSMREHYACTPNDLKSPFTQLARVEELLWSGTWGSGAWTPYFESGHPPPVRTPWDWLVNTRKDPEFICLVEWRPTKWTLGEAVEMLLAREGCRGYTTSRDDVLSSGTCRAHPESFQLLKQRMQCAESLSDRELERRAS
ncbi:MAG: hypothetical protein ABIG71_00940 [Candidatus Uhrbacteria bacterium]